MRRLFRLTGIALPAFLLTGCATMSVSSYVQRGLDLSRYRTYEWAASDSTTSIDPRLNQNIFNDRFRDAVEQHMNRLGFERSPSSNADLVIKYAATVDRREVVEPAGSDYGSCYGGDCRARSTDTVSYVYDALVLTIDLIDARTSQLVWRGWADQSVDGAIDDQDRLERAIEQSVAAILEKFPRRLTQATR